MYRHIVSFLFILSVFSHPAVAGFSDNKTIQFTRHVSAVNIYYGETVYVPFTLEYKIGKGHGFRMIHWVLPVNFQVLSSTQTSACLSFITEGLQYIQGSGTCQLLMAITGNQFAANNYQPLLIHSSYLDQVSWGNILVQVIPHPYSFNMIPDHQATAGIPFQGNVRNYVNYYDENLQAGIRPYLTATPASQHGLYWDSLSQSIVGTPTQTGTYIFNLFAHNGPVPMRIHVQANKAHTPVFKNHYTVPSGMPDTLYTFNLLNLLPDTVDVTVNKQTSFFIDKHYAYPDWLSIHPDNPQVLQGTVPTHVAGQTIRITLIAHSNTGGDSLPLTLSIPIAFDLTKKPVIKPGRLEKQAGTFFYEDLTDWIVQAEEGIRLIIDRVTPEAPWLTVSDSASLTLEGHIPLDAVGKTFTIDLFADSARGGRSDTVSFTLNIATDPDKRPRFLSGKPQLPWFYVNSPWQYDFQENADVFPTFQDEPWQIRFADNYWYPDWLRFEKNTLIAEVVPVDQPFSVCIWVVLANVPGGTGNPVELCLQKG